MEAMKFETNLQFFSGFYESIWSPESRLSDMEYEDEITEDDYDFDNEAYEKAVCEELCDVYNGWLKDVGLEGVSVSFDRIQSPAYYNYSTDKNCTIMTVTEEGRANILRLFEKFYWPIKVQVLRHHTSCSGFCSFMEDDARDWSDELLFGDDWQQENYLSCLCDYIICADWRSRGFSQDLCDMNLAAYDYMETVPEHFVTMKKEVV